MPIETKRPNRHPYPFRSLLQLTLSYAVAIGLLSFAASTTLQAYDCPAERQPNLPKSEEPANNIDKHKKQLRAYEAARALMAGRTW